MYMFMENLIRTSAQEVDEDEKKTAELQSAVEAGLLCYVVILHIYMFIRVYTYVCLLLIII